MTTPPDVVQELAAAFGVDTAFHDWRGRARTVDDATLRAVLSAFDVDTSTAQSCALALAQRREQSRGLPPCVVVRAGRPVEVGVATDAPLRVELEDGSSRTLSSAVLPADLPLGYHRLVVAAAGRQRSVHLIVTPDRLEWPAELVDPAWGLAVQLYSVRSRGSWGVGDLDDLTELARWSAREHGADFVLVNPVHAAEVVAPMNPSPYLPTSRRFANPLYLRVERVPEYSHLPAAAREAIDGLGAQLRADGVDPDGIDRDASWAAKRAALEVLFAAGRDSDRDAAFAAYCDREGEQLVTFAAWCVLSELHGPDWREWPGPLHDPRGAAVADTVAANRGRVDFHRWLQWLLDEQLGRSQDEARAAGMRLGIVHDVAVGVSASGADSWAWQDVMATTVTVGAPPDAYSQLGQDWQQPPWRPDRLAELGYAPLRDLFRNSLRHSGGLRVDHIIGLFRLWWIPAGAPAGAGTYVHYDDDALIGILVLEATRAGAVIIGEDLGNVEPRVRVALRERGLLGTSILWFENDPATGDPVPPQQWRTECLASVTTHDLPPTTGYLAADHVRLRDRLGLLTRSLADELAADARDKAAWIDELIGEGLLAEADRSSEDAVVLALHAALSRTPSRLRCVSLTDAVGERRTQNQPGTTDEYPNWRVPLGGPDGRPVLLEDVLTDPRVAALARAVRP